MEWYSKGISNSSASSGAVYRELKSVRILRFTRTLPVLAGPSNGKDNSEFEFWPVRCKGTRRLFHKMALAAFSVRMNNYKVSARVLSVLVN